jgi:hypothetical protein
MRNNGPQVRCIRCGRGPSWAERRATDVRQLLQRGWRLEFAGMTCPGCNGKFEVSQNDVDKWLTGFESKEA